MDRTGHASTTAAEIALAAMRASVFGTDPMAPAPPVSPSIVAPTAARAPVNASPHNGSKNPADLGDFLETAGLLEYDPEAISRIYTGHPQRLARRLRQTLIPIGLFLLGVGSDNLTGQIKQPERARARARECAELLAALGPAIIQACHGLSTRPDIGPPSLLEELAQLQDPLPGFDPELAMACIEEDLGAPVATLFAHLERDP
ncbi:MAG: AarF/ABC1/UbiB kinase family protein, partial [Cyanobacteriota bacterium]